MDWPEAPVELNDAQYEGFIKGYPAVIVDFWGPSCAPCKMIAPVLERMAGDLRGRVAFGKMDVTRNIKTASSLSIRSIPALAFYRNGQLVKMKMGFMNQSKLTMELQEIL